MAEQQKVTIRLPDDLRPAEREEIGFEIIEHIRERSKRGIGVRRAGRGFTAKVFPNYSEKYAARKGQNNVDLTLSQEMLESIEVLKHRKGEVTIGFQRGSDVNAKAEGNQIGSYGRSPNPRKARRFLGLTRDELDLILEEYGA